MATRRERVVLELDDRFSSGVARAAAETAILDKQLTALDGTSVRASKSTKALGKSTDTAGAAFRKSGGGLDSYTKRLGILATTVATLGPAFVPLGAAAVPTLAGVAAGLGAAAGAAGTAMLAFAGLGEGLDALNKYQLDPSAENLAALELEMDKLGASGAQFVQFLDSLEPELRALQHAARDGLLPGVEDSITELLGSADGLRNFIRDMGETMGGLASDASSSLTTDGDWQAFFQYLKTDGAPTLDAFGRSLGNFTAGLANMMTAFGPLTRDFSAGMLDMSEAFRSWSAGLSESETFQDFIDYVRQSAPQAREFLGSLADAVVALAQAFAPWGSVVLPALSAVLDVVAAIAGSPIGSTLATVGAGMLLLSKASSALGTALPKVTGGFGSLAASVRSLPGDLRAVHGQMGMIGPATLGVSQARDRLAKLGDAAKGAAGIAGMLALTSGATEADGAVGALASTAAGAAVGFSVGGPWGAAVGGAIGLVSSLGSSHDETAERVAKLTQSFDVQTGAITENTRAMVAKDLQDKDLLDAADQLGIRTDLVTNAVLGQAGAQEQLNAALSGYGTDRTISSAEDLAASYSDAEIKTIMADRAATKLRDTIPGLSDEFSTAAGEARQLAEAQGHGAAALGSTGNRARFAAVSLAELTAKQRAYSSATLASIDAGTSFGQALADARKQAEKGTQGFSRFTEAGRANRQMMSGLIGAYNNQSEAVKNNVGEYRRARANVEQLAKEMGLTERQTNMLTAALHKPKQIRVNDQQVRTARDAARALLEQINAVDGSEVNIRVVTTRINEAVNIVRNAANAARNAEGGVWQNNVRTYANGGLDRANAHQPEIAPGGAWRVWAEDETQGESYIPHANDYRRPRAKAILEQTAEMFGGEVEWYANGGSRRVAAGQGAGNRNGRIGLNADRVAHSLRGLERASKRLEKQVERERAQRDKWLERRNEAVSSTRSALTVNPWGSDSGNVFGSAHAVGSPGYASAQLRQQRARANAFTSAIRRLRSKGLNGAALTSILESPDPLATAQQMAAMPGWQVRQYEGLYNSATGAVNRAGRAVGDAAYGREVARQTRELRGANKRLDRIERAIKASERAADKSRQKAADRTGNKVKGAAGTGKRNQRYRK